jgi:hypothetical protein
MANVSCVLRGRLNSLDSVRPRAILLVRAWLGSCWTGACTPVRYVQMVTARSCIFSRHPKQSCKGVPNGKCVRAGCIILVCAPYLICDPDVHIICTAPINSVCISHTAPDYALCVSAGVPESEKKCKQYV